MDAQIEQDQAQQFGRAEKLHGIEIPEIQAAIGAPQLGGVQQTAGKQK